MGAVCWQSIIFQRFGFSFCWSWNYATLRKQKMGFVHLQNRKSIHMISAPKVNAHLFAWRVLRLVVFVVYTLIYEPTTKSWSYRDNSLLIVYQNVYKWPLIFFTGFFTSWNTAYWGRVMRARGNHKTKIILSQGLCFSIEKKNLLWFDW